MELGSIDDLPGLTEDELCSLALATETGRPPADDAVPMADYLEARQAGGGGESGGLLPTWYMPTPMARVGARWRMPVVLAIVAAFLSIEAAGLCSTFGQIVPA